MAYPLPSSDQNKKRVSFSKRGGYFTLGGRVYCDVTSFLNNKQDCSIKPYNLFGATTKAIKSILKDVTSRLIMTTSSREPMPLTRPCKGSAFGVPKVPICFSLWVRMVFLGWRRWWLTKSFCPLPSSSPQSYDESTSSTGGGYK